jgi:L-amino acid N-acyltransferase YncA
MARKIRPAETADIEAVAEIYRDAVLHGTATYELEPPSAAEMARRFLDLVEAGYPFLVAEEDGRVRGYAYGGPFRARPAYRFTVEDSIYVAPDAKGRGIGRMLLERLIAECEARGFRQLVAVIGDGRDGSASVILHERLGFSHCGRLEGSGFKHDRWLDTVFMQLPLNGGNSRDPDPQSLPERRFRGEG